MVTAPLPKLIVGFDSLCCSNLNHQVRALARIPGIFGLVHLTSRDQARIELQISGYQFPARVAHGGHDWDANWLLISGAVTQADGKSWSFDDPCLTTWAAAALGSWLSDVAAGTVPPSPLRTGQPEEILAFTEPNLTFGLEARVADSLRIRVHLSLEALPPWLQGAGRPGIFGYFVTLGVAAAELAQAAEDWTLNLTRFPSAQAVPGHR